MTNDDLQADQDYVRALFQRSIEVKQEAMAVLAAPVAQMAKVCTEALLAGKKILFCGNGGSAADAQHLAAELLVRLRGEVNRQGLPALALAMDSSSMTACGNDYSFEVYYQRMVEGLGQEGDVLIGITTSGKSGNILKAFEAARQKNIVTMGFLGGTGGPALPLCDHALVVPSSETGRIQESHITAGHALVELIEENLMKMGKLTDVSYE